MENTILVSVVIPAYNCECYISTAIESVLQQTYQNFELIVVNDASTDRTVNLLERYAQTDARIHVITNTENCGVAITRNRGIEQAKGQYIALLDGDDVWLPTKLERQIELAAESKADIIYSSYGFIDERGTKIKPPFLVPTSTDFNKMLGSSVISCSTAMIDAELLKTHPFDSSYYHEDYVLWMKLLSIPVVAVGDFAVLAYYRQVSGARSENKVNAAKKRWNVYRKALSLSFMRSAVAFFQYAWHGIKKYYF